MVDLEKYKYELEREIVERALREYEDGKITRDELKIIADFVISGMSQVKRKEDIQVFLSSLSERWPFFVNIVNIEKGHQKEEVEIKVYSDALNLVHSGKIDNAIELAKTMTN